MREHVEREQYRINVTALRLTFEVLAESQVARRGSLLQATLNVCSRLPARAKVDTVVLPFCTTVMRDGVLDNAADSHI
jgi:hypothetical protein